jgi:hypothetical protein
MSNLTCIGSVLFDFGNLWDLKWIKRLEHSRCQYSKRPTIQHRLSTGTLRQKYGTESIRIQSRLVSGNSLVSSVNRATSNAKSESLNSVLYVHVYTELFFGGAGGRPGLAVARASIREIYCRLRT